MRTVPSLGPRKPSRSAISVVFPAPFGPASPNTSPARSSSVRSSSARTSRPVKLRYRFPTWSNAITMTRRGAGVRTYGDDRRRAPISGDTAFPRREAALPRWHRLHARLHRLCARRNRARLRSAAAPRARTGALDPAHPFVDATEPDERAAEEPLRELVAAVRLHGADVEAARRVEVLLREAHRRELAQRDAVRSDRVAPPSPPPRWRCSCCPPRAPCARDRRAASDRSDCPSPPS